MHQPQPGQPLRHALSGGHAAEAVHHTTSWWSSAQSSPTNNTPPSSLWINLGSSPREPATPNGACSTSGTPPHQSSDFLSDQRGTI
jgi:hypothetical protein